MKKKLIGMVGMICLVTIIAGCGTVPGERSVASNEAEDPHSTPAEVATESNSEADAVAEESVPLAKTTNVEEMVTEEVEPKTDLALRTETLTGLTEIPQPINELKEGEYQWSQLLARDSIFPIYDPEFVPANDAPYDDNELVIGIKINGEAKAYAIGPLNGREMVNDTVGVTPVLVTW